MPSTFHRKQKRRTRGSEQRVNTFNFTSSPAGTLLVFDLWTSITDPHSIKVLIAAARKALAASVLDSEKALLEPSHPC